MYRSIGKPSGLYLAIHKFKISLKRISFAYKTGIHYKNSMDSYTVFIVIHTFRVIISFRKKINTCCG